MIFMQQKPVKSVNFTHLRVLAIEDQIDTLQMLIRMLGEIGVKEIFTATDGQKGAEFMEFTADMVDIILCDWNMPNKSGIELLKELRRDSVNIPFIIITAAGDIESVLQAKDAGVSAFIRKPFSLQDLKIKINYAMSKADK